LYAVLEQQGKKPTWNMHPDYDPKNGIYATTGSLGHGLPIAVGMAFAKKQKNDGGKIYVMVGDGEMQEGSNWEALDLAKLLDVNLNIIVDWNKYQAIGSLNETSYGGGLSLFDKFKSFGCDTFLIGGHDKKELSNLNNLEDGLSAVILSTTKGKGVDVLEKNHAHVWSQNQEEYFKSLEVLNISNLWRF